jgi:hypothetical protein
MFKRSLFLGLALAITVGSSVAADDPVFEFDWLAIFRTANKFCVGQNYSAEGIDLRMKQIGRRLGWSPQKLADETLSREITTEIDLRVSQTAFCNTARMGRRQYGDDYLRRVGVIY